MSHKILKWVEKNKRRLSRKVSWKTFKWVEFQNLKSLPGLVWIMYFTAASRGLRSCAATAVYLQYFIALIVRFAISIYGLTRRCCCEAVNTPNTELMWVESDETATAWPLMVTVTTDGTEHWSSSYTHGHVHSAFRLTCPIEFFSDVAADSEKRRWHFITSNDISAIRIDWWPAQQHELLGKRCRNAISDVYAEGSFAVQRLV